MHIFVIHASNGVIIMVQLCAKKSPATQGVVDSLKNINFCKMQKRINFINPKSNCPDHSGTYIHKGLTALLLNITVNTEKSFKMLLKESTIAVCTAKQWKYVPSEHPIQLFRYKAQTKELFPTNHYMFESKLIVLRDISDMNKKNINSMIVDIQDRKLRAFCTDFVLWSLGLPIKDRMHNISIENINKYSNMIDQLFDLSIKS